MKSRFICQLKRFHSVLFQRKYLKPVADHELKIAGGIIFSLD